MKSRSLRKMAVRRDRRTLHAKSARNRLRFETLEDRRVLAAGFFQGFESDTGGWFDFGDDTIAMVGSGSNGIASQGGDYHAEVSGGATTSPTTHNSSAFTRWGGYTDVFPDGGYTTSAAIYLDMGTSAANDTRFDFSSAVNTPSGDHRRDFIFNGGFYNDNDTTGSGPRFVISASNNSVGSPKNPVRSPVTITDTGWYTFQHRFYDSGSSILAVDLSILESDGDVVGSWTLSDSSDEIGSTVGGNRYGWFANNQFDFLAIDNTYQTAPDEVYVDDDWSGVSLGADPDGTGPANAFGFDAFATIQDGLDAVAADGTVDVAAGNYTEGPQFHIDQSVTVVGEHRDTTIVNPAGNTGGSGDSRGWWLVDSGVEFHLSNVTLDGNSDLGTKVYQAIRHKGTGTIDNVAFEDIGFSQYVGFGVAAFGGGGAVDVTNSTFANIERIGVQYFGAGTSGTFSGNTYTGKGTGDHLDYAVEVGAGAIATIADSTITGNRGEAASDGSVSAGILATTFFGAGTSAEIKGNTIEDNTVGIYVGFGGADSTDVYVHCNLIADNGTGVQFVGDTTGTVRSNDIVGNTEGLDSDSSNTIDAVLNWWGDSSGPSGDGPGTGDSVFGDVDFMPWLMDSVFSGNNLVYSGTDGSSLIVNEATGEYTFTDADGVIYSGTGARIQNGMLKIHDQSSNGKVDVKGDADGTIGVSLKGKGKPRTFMLELEDDLLAAC